MTHKTCNHLYDTGGTCNSVAAKDSNYCLFHLRYRARELRRAQARARMERFDLHLPPIESMSTVLSAVNQLVEAVAADMIDLKRADFLLSLCASPRKLSSHPTNGCPASITPISQAPQLISPRNSASPATSTSILHPKSPSRRLI